jgi:hypothetical protein
MNRSLQSVDNVISNSSVRERRGGLTVQIGLSQLSINAHPVGQVVKFAVCVKTNFPSCLLCLAPIGSAIMVAKIRMKFITTNTVWSFPMTLLNVLAKTPCIKTQARNTP